MNRRNTMTAFAMKEEFDNVVSIFTQVQQAMSKCSDFPVFHFKPQQIQCWAYLLEGKDVIGVLPTGFGKSTIFQLLPFILPSQEPDDRAPENIVIVVGPLNSIMADQMSFLTDVGITNGALRLGDTALPKLNKLFPQKLLINEELSDDEDLLLPEISKPRSADEDEDLVDFTLEPFVSELEDSVEEPEVKIDEGLGIPKDIIDGKCSVVFGHPEGYLSPSGRLLLSSAVYQRNVVAVIIDEVHCMLTW